MVLVLPAGLLRAESLSPDLVFLLVIGGILGVIAIPQVGWLFWVRAVRIGAIHNKSKHPKEPPRPRTGSGRRKTKRGA